MKSLIVIIICFLTPYLVFSENIQTENSSIIIVKDYLSGIEFVISDIENETTESTGTKILILTLENKFAFVFWGIAEVTKSQDPEVIAMKHEIAIEQSKMKAAITFLKYFQHNIDQTSWNGFKNDEIMEAETFEEAFVDRFCQRIKEVEFYSDYIASNHIPPLIIQKSFESEQYKNNGYGKIFTIFIFYPELTEKTQKIMKNINIKEMLENYLINVEKKTVEVD